MSWTHHCDCGGLEKFLNGHDGEVGDVDKEVTDSNHRDADHYGARQIHIWVDKFLGDIVEVVPPVICPHPFVKTDGYCGDIGFCTGEA